MMHGLNFNENDSNYMLLNEIFNIIGSRESKQIMSRNGLKPLNKIISLVKTVILAAYFECDISFDEIFSFFLFFINRSLPFGVYIVESS